VFTINSLKLVQVRKLEILPVRDVYAKYKLIKLGQLANTEIDPITGDPCKVA